MRRRRRKEEWQWEVEGKRERERERKKAVRAVCVPLVAFSLSTPPSLPTNRTHHQGPAISASILIPNTSTTGLGSSPMAHSTMCTLTHQQNKQAELEEKGGRRRSYEGRRARGLGRRHWGRLGHAPRLSATPALGPHCDEGMGTLLPSLVVLNCHHRCHHHRQQRLQRTKAQQIPEKKR